MLNFGRTLPYKKVNHTLVVIDMQSYFIGDPVQDKYLSCLKKVGQEIISAKKRGSNIILVECDYHENKPASPRLGKVSCAYPTVSVINRLVKGYDKYVYVYKYGQDGSREIIDALAKKKIPRSNIRICGVYAEMCVKDTVLGLRRGLPRSHFYLVKDGIQSAYRDASLSNVFNDLTFYDNIKLAG